MPEPEEEPPIRIEFPKLDDLAREALANPGKAVSVRVESLELGDLLIAGLAAVAKKKEAVKQKVTLVANMNMKIADSQARLSGTLHIRKPVVGEMIALDETVTIGEGTLVNLPGARGRLTGQLRWSGNPPAITIPEKLKAVIAVFDKKKEFFSRMETLQKQPSLLISEILIEQLAIRGVKVVKQVGEDTHEPTKQVRQVLDESALKVEIIGRPIAAVAPAA